MLLFAAVKVYYQCGLQATQSNMLLELFVQVVSEPCFNILRTKEQLGRFTLHQGEVRCYYLQLLRSTTSVVYRLPSPICC